MNDDSFFQFGNNLDPQKKKKGILPTQSGQNEGIFLPLPLDENAEPIQSFIDFNGFSNVQDEAELNTTTTQPKDTQVTDNSFTDLFNGLSNVEDDAPEVDQPVLNTTQERVQESFSIRKPNEDLFAIGELLAKESEAIPLFRNNSAKEIISFLNNSRNSKSTVGQTIDQLFTGDTDVIKKDFEKLGLSPKTSLSEVSNLKFLRSFSNVGRFKEVNINEEVKERLGILDVIETPDGNVSTIDGNVLKENGEFTDLGQSVVDAIKEAGDSLPLSLQAEVSIGLQEAGNRFQNSTNTLIKNTLNTMVALSALFNKGVDGLEAVGKLRQEVGLQVDKSVDEILSVTRTRERFNINGISDIVNPIKFSIAVAEQSPNLLSAIGITIASPILAPVTVPTFFATQHFAEALDKIDEIDALPESDISEGEKLLRAVSITAINTVLDTISFNTTLGRINPFTRAASNFMLAAITEPTTEALQEVNLEIGSTLGVTDIQFNRLREISSQAFFQSLPVSILSAGLSSVSRSAVPVEDAAIPVISFNENGETNVRFKVVRKESTKVGQILTEDELVNENLPVPDFRVAKLEAQLENLGIEGLAKDAFIGLMEIQAESNGATLESFLAQHNFELNGISKEDAKISIDNETKRVIQGLDVNSTLSHIQVENITTQLSGRLEIAKDLLNKKIDRSVIKALTGWFFDNFTGQWRVSVNPLEFNLNELNLTSEKGIQSLEEQTTTTDVVLSERILNTFPELKGFTIKKSTTKSEVDLENKTISLNTSDKNLTVQQQFVGSVQSLFEKVTGNDSVFNVFSVVENIRSKIESEELLLSTFRDISKASQKDVFKVIKQFLALRYNVRDATDSDVRAFISEGIVRTNLEITNTDENTSINTKVVDRADETLAIMLLGLRTDSEAQIAFKSATAAIQTRNRLEKNRPNAFFTDSNSTEGDVFTGLSNANNENKNIEVSPDEKEISRIINLVKKAKDTRSLLHAYSEFVIRTMSPANLKTAEKVFKVKNGVWTRNNINAFADSFLSQVKKGVASKGNLAPIFSLFRTAIMQAGDIYFDENQTLPKGFTSLMDAVFNSYDTDLRSFDIDASARAWKGITLSISRAFKKLGQPKTGDAVRSMFSVAQSYIVTGRIRFKEISALARKANRSLIDIMFIAESKTELEKVRKAGNKDLEAAVVAVRDYFKSMGDDLLQVGGLSRTFQERMADDVQALRDKGEITDAELQDKLADIQDIEFVAIEYAAIAAFLDDENVIKLAASRSRKRNFGLATTNKRKSLTLKNAIGVAVLAKEIKEGNISLEDAEDIDIDKLLTKERLENFDVSLIFSSYARRTGNDIALSKVRNAAILEKAAVPAKSANVNLGFQRSTTASGLFKGLLLAPHLNNILMSFANAERKGTARRLITAVKLFQFVNPAILAQYSVVLSSMLASSNTVAKLPRQMVTAIRSLLTADDLYKRAALNNTFSEVSVDPRRVVEDEFRKAGYTTLQNAVSTVKEIFAPFSEEPAFKQFPANVLRMNKIALFKVYDMLSSIAWGFENIFRMTNFINLIEDGETDAEAGRLSSKIHADFSDIPPDRRAFLNAFFFTPSYKIAMFGLMRDAIESITSTLRGDATVSNARLGAAIVKAFLILGGTDLFLLSMGFEREKFAWRYRKEIPTSAGKKDVVITLSLPINLFLKFIYRGQRALDPDVLNPISKFLDQNKGEVTPLLLIINQLITGKDVFGNDIVKPGEEIFGTGGLKLVKHALAEGIPITKLFIENDQRERSLKQDRALLDQLGAIGLWSADILSNIYVSKTAREIDIDRINAFRNEISRAMSPRDDIRNIRGLEETEDTESRILRVLTLIERLEKLVDLLIVNREINAVEMPTDPETAYKDTLPSTILLAPPDSIQDVPDVSQKTFDFNGFEN